MTNPSVIQIAGLNIKTGEIGGEQVANLKYAYSIKSKNINFVKIGVIATMRDENRHDNVLIKISERTWENQSARETTEDLYTSLNQGLETEIAENKKLKDAVIYMIHTNDYNKLFKDFAKSVDSLSDYYDVIVNLSDKKDMDLKNAISKNFKQHFLKLSCAYLAANLVTGKQYEMTYYNKTGDDQLESLLKT